MNKTPYIGVTDFTSRAQVIDLKDLIPPWVDRRLHVGAMMSYKTLNGIPTSSGWENIWLNEHGLRELFVPDSEVFNVLHYADYPDDNGKVLTTPQDVVAACCLAGEGITGLQLDMIWPNPKILYEVKEAFPDLEIILQVSSKAIAYAWKHKLDMIDALSAYNDDHIDYILLDYGMGRGTPFNPTQAVELVEAALTVYSQRRVALAGGLGPNTFNNLKPIFDKYPDISCDAQGQLRASGSAKDPLDIHRVSEYILGVSSLL